MRRQDADDDTEDTVSDMADSTPDLIDAQATPAAQAEPKPAKRTPARKRTTPAKRTPARKNAGRATRTSGRASSGSSSVKDVAGSLASALRELVGGIETEVTAITALSSEIDQHVRALNDLRAEATRRLLRLDDLRSAAEDVNLSAFLDTSIQPQLPQVEEDFPDRIYGG